MRKPVSRQRHTQTACAKINPRTGTSDKAKQYLTRVDYYERTATALGQTAHSHLVGTVCISSVSYVARPYYNMN